MTGDLFQFFPEEPIRLASGGVSDWKIDCDALSDGDVATVAYLICPWVTPFSTVESVPTGGDRLAEAMREYATGDGPVLICDDVLTTGVLMERQRADRDAVGAVVFARAAIVPGWIVPLFRMLPVTR